MWEIGLTFSLLDAPTSYARVDLLIETTKGSILRSETSEQCHASELSALSCGVKPIVVWACSMSLNLHRLLETA